MGALLITVSLVTVRTLGAGGVVAATLCGQLVVSAALDRAGVLGLEATALTPERLLGFVAAHRRDAARRPALTPPIGQRAAPSSDAVSTTAAASERLAQAGELGDQAPRRAAERQAARRARAG